MLSELLALIGLSWSRVLLYPGGLTALTLAWIWQGSWTGSWTVINWRSISAASLAQCLIASVPPLLLISLLPLPGAAPLARPIDLPTALVLLEWPLLLALFPRLSQAFFSSEVSSAWFQALQRGYAVLILAMLALAQSIHTFSLDGLVAAPAQPGLLPYVLRTAGAIGWVLALPPLLGLGPFEQKGITEIPCGDELRVVGHSLLAALPWLALAGDLPFLTPLPPLLIALLLAGMHRFGQRSLRGWMWMLDGAALVLLALLAWAAATSVAARLQ